MDLLLLDQITWEKLVAEATVEVLAKEVSAGFPSPLHLIAMKLHSASDGTRGSDGRNRDWDDVVALCRSQKIDPSQELARELVLRYGSEETLSQLINALAS